MLLRCALISLVLFQANGALASEASAAPRAARSVHLGYPAPDATEFYTELTVEKSVPGSYFMACGFNRGYFGIQELGDGRKVVIFSVWDPTQGDNPHAVPEEQRVEVLFQGEDVLARRFGGEGTGGQSFFDFDWQPGEAYRFRVTATRMENKTAYAAYFYLPESAAWKHLVTFRTASGGDALKGLYSFIEDFRRDGHSAGEIRRATFGNGWVRDLQGEWHPLLKARFTASGASWEAKETIDAGVVEDRFFLQTGGDTKTSTPLRTIVERPAGGDPPTAIPPEGSSLGETRPRVGVRGEISRWSLPRRFSSCIGGESRRGCSCPRPSLAHFVETRNVSEATRYVLAYASGYDQS